MFSGMIESNESKRIKKKQEMKRKGKEKKRKKKERKRKKEKKRKEKENGENIKKELWFHIDDKFSDSFL